MARGEAAAPADGLPPLYARWMRELLGGPLPAETRATCGDCAMLPRTADPAGTDYFFTPQIKCCTYLPELANFLTGRILRDTDPASAEGRATVERRLSAGVGVTPLGLGQPASYLLWYNNSAASFGRARALRCPHYLEEGGRCGVWRHRESTCATWFCKHDRGAVGRQFWREGLHRLLKAVEGALARWCVLELDPGSAALVRLVETTESGETIDEGQLDGAVDPRTYRTLWGRWAGREREFFEACAARVDDLGWEEVAGICGPDVRLFARLTREAYGQLHRHDVAPALRCGTFRVIWLRANTARLSTYSDFDPIDVPAPVLGALQYFEAQPTGQALHAIAEQEGFTLEPALIRKLTDFGVLVPATGRDDRRGPV